MKLAKVITLSDKVEVIIKKIVESGNHGFSLNFVGILEDDSLVNTTLTATYNSDKKRDKEFDAINKETVIQVASTITPFKNLI